MTFLTPMPAILAAAVALPALLLFYLLRLRRRPVRVSSTLLWYQATRDLQVNIPFRLLRPTALFLLQLAILLLFLGAMARPAFDLPAHSAARVTFLIDRSASMSSLDGSVGSTPVTRLDEAKSRAAKLLGQLSRSGGQSAVSVIAFAAEARAVTTFAGARSDAGAAINAIEPTDQPGNLAAALDLAATMLTADTDESRARERPLVVLFSDGSFADDRIRTLPGADFRFERIAPATFSADGGTPHADNLGIVSLAARRDADDPATIRVFVRLQSASPGETAVPISLWLNGVQIDRRPLVIPAAKPAGAAGSNGTMSPADTPSATTTFQFASRDGGVAEVRIDRPDLLAADNSSAIVIAPATKPRLLLVIPDPTPRSADQPPPRGQEWIFTDLLSEMELPFRTMTASTFERDAASERGTQADMIIFDRVRPASLPSIPTLSFGAGVPLPGLEVRPPPVAQPQSTYIISWQRTHPLLRDVSLDAVFVSSALSADDVAPEPGTTITELARGSTGPLILQAERRGVRHVILTFAGADSTWPAQVSFPIFIAGAIDHLTLRASARAGQMFTTGAPTEITIPAGRSRIEFDGPSRLIAEAPLSTGATPEPRRVGLGLIERAGIYRPVESPTNPSMVPAIAVNLLDPVESALAVADSVRVGGEVVAGSGGGQGPRELWPWCLIAALVLLMVEWFVNAWLQRV